MLNYQRVDWKKTHDSFGSKPFKTWRLWCYDTSAVNEMPFINFINPSPKSPFLWMVLHPSKNETCLVYGIEFTTSDYPHLSPWYTTFVYFHGEFTFDLAEKSPWTSSSRHPDHGATKKLVSCRSLEDLLCFAAPFLLRFRRASCWPGAMITAPALGHGKVPWGVRNPMVQRISRHGRGHKSMAFMKVS